MMEQLRYYLAGQASSWPVYILEQFVLGLCGWVPTIVGIGLRGLAYRLIMKLNGMPAIEAGGRFAHANGVKLGKGIYLDQGYEFNAGRFG